jgi:hypothetical protein
MKQKFLGDQREAEMLQQIEQTIPCSDNKRQGSGREQLDESQ